MTRLTLSERQTVQAGEAIKARARKDAKKARPPRAVPIRDGKQREPAIVDKPFRAFIRRQTCCVGPVGCSGGIEAAHVRFGRQRAPTGLGIKPDDPGNLVPLCHEHHNGSSKVAQHGRGERLWWEERGIDPHARGAEYYARFQRGDA